MWDKRNPHRARRHRLPSASWKRYHRPRASRSMRRGSPAAAAKRAKASPTAWLSSGESVDKIRPISSRRFAVTRRTSCWPDAVGRTSTSRRLSGLGTRSTQPPSTIRSITRLNVEGKVPISAASALIRTGPDPLSTTKTLNCGRDTCSSASDIERATIARSARDAVIVSAVANWPARCVRETVPSEVGGVRALSSSMNQM